MIDLIEEEGLLESCIEMEEIGMDYLISSVYDLLKMDYDAIISILI